MRKSYKIAMLTVLAGLFIVFATGCFGGSPGEAVPELVGTWAYSGNDLWEYNFFADGRGTRGFLGEVESFAWGVRPDSNELRIHREGSVPLREIRNERWTFSILNGMLRIDSLQVDGLTHTYHQRGFTGTPYSALVGRWNFADFLPYRLELNSDGTGTRGALLDTEEVRWGTVGSSGTEGRQSYGILHIYRLGNLDDDIIRHERWAFTIVEDSLYLHSQQIDSIREVFVKCGGPGEVYEPLVGDWAWNSDTTWQYRFNADGTGTMGTPGELAVIQWGVMDGELRLFFHGSLWDALTFTVSGSTLSMESSFEPGIIYGYTRVGYAPEYADELINPSLVGTWAWDGNSSWLYEFYDTGFGRRGFPGSIVEFEWASLYDDLWLLMPSGYFEVWHYEIDGDSLRLESIDFEDGEPPMVFYYTRN